jgi:hypothetical protein
VYSCITVSRAWHFTEVNGLMLNPKVAGNQDYRGIFDDAARKKSGNSRTIHVCQSPMCKIVDLVSDGTEYNGGSI